MGKIFLSIQKLHGWLCRRIGYLSKIVTLTFSNNLNSWRPSIALNTLKSADNVFWISWEAAFGLLSDSIRFYQEFEWCFSGKDFGNFITTEECTKLLPASNWTFLDGFSPSKVKRGFPKTARLRLHDKGQNPVSARLFSLKFVKNILIPWNANILVTNHHIEKIREF